jgi:Na+/H+ antiporter NhaD/arsenite permease-like protein
VYRHDLFGQDTARRRPLAMRALEMEVRPARGPHFWLLLQSLSVTVVAVVLFFVGLPISLVALGAAAVLLLSRVRPDKIYRQIDWPLLVMFSGLFVVVRAFETRIVSHWDVGSWSLLIDHPVTMLSVVSAGLSNLVSNVPAVLLFKPIMGAIAPAEQETAWLALAMSSTLAGNLTVLGSVANLIVAETARRDGVRISFWSFFRIGLPLTLITLAIGICWLQFAPY